MQFKITARLPMGIDKEGKPLPAIDANGLARRRLEDARRNVCQGCGHLHIERCCKPCPICPVDERRNQPWAKLPKCPDNRWAL